MLKDTLFVMLVTGTVFAQGSAMMAQAGPADLQVTAASKSQVELGWKPSAGATGYVVEREAGAGTFAAVGKVAKDTTFSDSKIDPYTIYTYRVKATLGPQKFSGPSNEVMAGPTPTGFNVVTLTPKDRQDDFANGMTMVLDTNEDPVFAYIFRDPNKLNKQADNQLLFGGWDRTGYRWREPVLVDVIGPFHRQTQRTIALAMDASTGELGLCFVRASGDVEIALSSDKGATWSKQPLPRTGVAMIEGCTLAMGGGNVYMASFGPAGPMYITGAASDPAATWKQTRAPLAAKTDFRISGHIALDSEGKPAMVYATTPKQTYNVITMYWRPGQDPVKVMDTNNLQNDDPDMRLEFQGTKPRVVFLGMRDKVADHQMWVSSSEDGSTWADPVVIARDGNSGMGGPLSFQISGRGEYALLARYGGGNWTGVKCGMPKVARSPDGMHWTSCSPSGTLKPDHRAGDVTGAFAGDNRLYIGYRSFSSQPPMPDGIVVWRESGNAAANATVHK